MTHSDGLDAGETLDLPEGPTVLTAGSVAELLGQHSAAVFRAGEHRDGDRRIVNKTTEIVVLADPYPEYKLFVFRDGEFQHSSTLLTMEYEGVFEQHIEDYGQAEILPLGDVECVERDERALPQYTEAEA